MHRPKLFRTRLVMLILKYFIFAAKAPALKGRGKKKKKLRYMVISSVTRCRFPSTSMVIMSFNTETTCDHFNFVV